MEENKNSQNQKDLAGPFGAPSVPDAGNGVGVVQQVAEREKPIAEKAEKNSDVKREDASDGAPKERVIPSGQPLIEADNISVIYNQGKSSEVRSLEKVSVKIYPREYVIIFGPSGCGKSTLLYSIAGLQAPTQGRVLIGGERISQMDKKHLVDLHRFKIGMIFQAFYLINSLSVIDNVCLPRVFCGADKKKRADEGIMLLRRFSIVEQANKFPSQLSGGQKQRVSIARALINNPDIILADEPVGNLDSESSVNVLQILKELNEVDKKTIILVTHNVEHLHFADRVIHMRDGRVTKEEVFHEKRPDYVLKQVEEDAILADDLTPDLKMLMRTFKNLSPQQIGAMLVPYKSNQLLTYLLAGMTEEQMSTAGAFLNELLFRNISVEDFGKSLDLDLEKGGAGWNKKKALTLAKKVGDILEIVKRVSDTGNIEEGVMSLSNYLISRFNLNIDEEARMRFESIIRLRVGNKIDQVELQKKLDVSKAKGGVGLLMHTAEKIANEVEIVMLLKYTV